LAHEAGVQKGKHTVLRLPRRHSSPAVWRQLRDSTLLTERAQNAPGDPQAWKKLIGTKRVAARLETLPDNKLRRGAFAVSSVVQLTLALIVISLPLIFPEQISIRAIYQVTPVEAPQTEVPIEPEKPPEKPEVHKKAEPIPVKPAEPVRVAKLFAPQPLIAPKPKAPEKLNSEVPKLEPVPVRTKLDTSTAEPERPREPVKTGMLNTSKAPEPTVKAASETVQTGGFGDPHGFAGGAPDAKHGNVARLGSFELPSGPGYGNGTGGANGARGVVASAGFANSSAAKASASGARGAVQSGGFGSVEIAPAAKPQKQAEQAPAIQPVVILSKPNPAYSDEARKLGIEGEVLVEVIFLASGQVRAVRVTKGLGHGLDEAALHAAEQIRFKPALQEGQAVDFPAIAHIIFQLAY
jgi:TonB family protein